MRQLTFTALFGILSLVAAPARAQGPYPGQPYQVPGGYEAYGPGTVINYGGYNYAITGDGTMLLAAQPGRYANPQSQSVMPLQGDATAVSPDGTQLNGGYSQYGPGPNAFASYADAQGNRGNGYAQFNAANPGMGGAFQGADGSSASGMIQANGGQFTYQGADGSQANGYARFNGANPGMGGAFQGADGSSGNGMIQANAGQFAYQDADGSQVGGQYQFNGQGGAIGGYQYDPNGNGYNGNLAWQGNQVHAQGEVRQPGYIPGTQDHIGGAVNAQGINSSADAHYTVYDPTGQIPLGGVNGHLDRYQYNQAYQGGAGPVHGGMNQGVNFGGVNSQVYVNQGGNVAGIGGYGMGMDASLHGVNANGQVNVGGVHAGVGVGLDNHGVHFNSSLPAIHGPNLPHVSMQHVSLPSYSGSSFSIPSSSSWSPF